MEVKTQAFNCFRTLSLKILILWAICSARVRALPLSDTLPSPVSVLSTSLSPTQWAYRDFTERAYFSPDTKLPMPVGEIVGITFAAIFGCVILVGLFFMLLLCRSH